MGYYNDFTGSISYENIENEKALRAIHNFINGDALNFITAINQGYNDSHHRNQFSGNVTITSHRIELNCKERKGYFFKNYLQEIINFITALGYTVKTVYIQREGEEMGDLETYTLTGNTINSQKSKTAQELFGKN